jgi:sugar lactone lactonase YvrE
VISTIAGTGIGGFGGDAGPAVSGQLNSPSGVTVDSSGNLFIADSANSRIRKVTGGVISTFAGTGAFAFGGDNGPAVQASLSFPTGLHADMQGNVYIADTLNNRIRKVDSSGIISTVAGVGAAGSSGDNGQAVAAQLNAPYGVTVDSLGVIFIGDTANHRVRRVDTNGVITRFVGATEGFSGDGGPAASAQLDSPRGLSIDSAGNLYIADHGNSRIRRVQQTVAQRRRGQTISH